MRWPWKKQNDNTLPPEPTMEPVLSDTLTPANDPETGAPPDDIAINADSTAQTAHPLADRLTPRERDVFDLMVRGMKLKEIGDELGVKYSTVNTHQKKVYRKLGVNSRAECILRYGEPRKG